MIIFIKAQISSIAQIKLKKIKTIGDLMAQCVQ